MIFRELAATFSLLLLFLIVFNNFGNLLLKKCYSNMADISIIHKNRSEKHISEIKDGNKQ